MCRKLGVTERSLPELRMRVRWKCNYIL